MLKINKLGLICLMLLIQYGLFAQNNTNSPYTRYGLGELADRSVGAGRAMGGIGFGLRSSKQINPMNPASYSSIDSMSFMFDFGASGQVYWFNDGVNKHRNMNGNVDYLVLQIPIMKRLAMSVGLLPYSHVGYDYGASRRVGDVSYTEQFVGSGSISDLYAGISYDLWKNRLAVGANFGFLFGSIKHEQNVLLPTSSEGYSVYRSQKFTVHDLKMDFGVQYTQPISKTESFTLGVVYSPAQKMKAKSYNVTQKYLLGSSSAIENKVDTITGLATDIPNSFGIGLTYTKKDKLLVGVDFLYENWEKSKFLGESGKYENRIRIGAGAEYIINDFGRNYFSRVRYRAGLHYSDSYANVAIKENGVEQNCGYKEYGVGIGFGFPIPDYFGKESLVNITFEYVKVKPEIKTMVNEQYFRFTLNYSFNERWFQKFKLK